MTWIRSVAWQMGVSSWPLRRTGTPPLFLASHKTILDDVRDRMLADTITCSRHGCTAVCSINVQRTLAKGQSPTSVTGRRTRQRDRPQVLSSHRRLCGLHRRGGRWECRRACGWVRERHLPSGQARDRMVMEDAVTSMRHKCTTARSSNFC